MNHYVSYSVSHLRRRVARLNTVVQRIALLAGTLISSDVVAQGEHRFIPPSAQPALMTTIHTLVPGESIHSVAKAYNVSVDVLRALNASHPRVHDFDDLQPGDELTVPLAPLPTLQWEPEGVSRSGFTPEEALPQKVAIFSSRAGSFLASNPRRNSVFGIAGRMVSSEAGGAIQQWFNRFGTARVRLDMDQRLSLKSSQFDLLLPLGDRENRLLFIQGGIHNTDERTQSSLGLGIRYFVDNAMVGGNGFLDYDLSHSHARSGFGLEYWRNLLKVSVNGYLRLSNWKRAGNVVEQQERPANGWDIRALAYLPRWPQWGGELLFEQYYGKQVALFGRDTRQRNPYAATLGVNYTPFPLLTVSTEQRQGHRGEKDTRVNLQLNYQMGTPWSRQIDPDAVGVLRSLVGGRYDLVERNGNMVLEYREKASIRLSMASRVTGFSGEQKSLNVVVNNTRNLARIEWFAPELNDAGGKIIAREQGSYAVVLPNYKQGEHAVNTYRISAVAIDIEGKRSNQEEAQVSVHESFSAVHSSRFSPSESRLIADGQQLQVLTLSLLDGQQRPLNLPVSSIQINTTGIKSASVSKLERKAPGRYQMTVKVGTERETITLTPSLNGIPLPSARVIISPSVPYAPRSTFSLHPSAVTANGVATATILFTVRDNSSHALGGIADKLSLSVKGELASLDAPVTVSHLVESGTVGTYVATLTSTGAGTYMVRPQYNGMVLGGLAAKIEFHADVASAKLEKITTDKALMLGNGTDFVKYTAVVTDAQGNRVPNAVVQWRNTFGKLSAQSVSTSKEGEASVILKSTDKGKVKVTASINRTSLVDSNVKVSGVIEDTWNVGAAGGIYHSPIIRGFTVLGFVAKSPTQGPMQLVWSSSGHEVLTASLTNDRNERQYRVKFRAYRYSGCKLRPFNAAINCVVAANGISARLVFVMEDNDTLPPGHYVGDIHFRGKNWHDDYDVDYLLHTSLRITQ